MTVADDDAAQDKAMPLLDHLIELRKRLIFCAVGFIVAFFACFFVAEEIFEFLVRPLAAALDEKEGGRMIFTALHEAFFTYVKVAFWTAALIAFPLISMQIWLFVAPGLYRNERRAFLPFLIATPILFCTGAALVYYGVMPVAWEFFLDFQKPADPGGPRDRGRAQGRPVSVARHAVDLRLRHRLRAAGVPDAAGAGRESSPPTGSPPSGATRSSRCSSPPRS